MVREREREKRMNLKTNNNSFFFCLRFFLFPLFWNSLWFLEFPNNCENHYFFSWFFVAVDNVYYDQKRSLHCSSDLLFFFFCFDFAYFFSYFSFTISRLLICYNLIFRFHHHHHQNFSCNLIWFYLFSILN